MFEMNPGGGMYPEPMPQPNPYAYQYPPPGNYWQNGPAQPQRQPAQQTQQEQPAQQQNGPDWLRVPSAEHVEKISVPPGGKAWVMVQNAPIFALLEADKIGLVTVDFYRFEKIDKSLVVNNNASSAGNGMTREEIETLISNQLSAILNRLNAASATQKEGAINE